MPLSMAAGIMAAGGAVLGSLTGSGLAMNEWLLALAGAAFFAIATLLFAKTGWSRGRCGIGTGVLLLLIGLLSVGLAFGLLAGIIGYLAGRIGHWLESGDYRTHLPPYLTSREVAWHYGFRILCGVIFFFLIAPIVVIIPLSFNAENFFTFTPGMLALDPAAYSLKHYEDFFGNSQWQQALRNSLSIAPMATLLSVSFGTLAAIGLSQKHVPFRRAIMAVLISPMIVPLIISAAGMYFFYSRIGLQGTYWGVVLAHAALGIPFVIITVTATLVGFDESLTRASANMGAGPVRTFFKVQMPLILPGVISGGLFAFITSFDEVVVVLFVGSAGQKTLPWQMFTGLREQISPTILAVATLLVAISIALLATLELLRRRSERLRGMSPG
ncbi:MAG: polyamine ABC transporter permease [Alphaproteobacteria bacterium HGW-Alphaproteobacteria-2]|nr:MAG: polyamine ABC transporter permease [Alphaproteobacteria bacterium HGW-Alphaproteobacteria-2]